MRLRPHTNPTHLNRQTLPTTFSVQGLPFSALSHTIIA